MILPVVALVVAKPAFRAMFPPVAIIGPETLITLPIVMLAVLVADPRVTLFKLVLNARPDVSKLVVKTLPIGAMITLPAPSNL